MSYIRVPFVLLIAAIVALACASPAASLAPVPSVAASASPAASAASPAAAAQTIDLSEWKVVVADTMKAGQADFTITNSGTVPHELLVFKSDLAPSAYPSDGAGTIDEEGGGVSLISDGDNIDPGGTQSRTVDLTTPGSYLFVCNIPGHFKQGMFTVVTVTQ
jgi:uncharacterized cupredoxin-like copper-binding protein